MVLFFALLLLCGCWSRGEITREQKAASLDSLGIDKIEGEPAEAFCLRRMAMVLVGYEISDVDFLPDGHMRVHHKPPDDRSAMGSAAAVSGDGYYLTAAHCLKGVNSDKVWLIGCSPDDRFYGQAHIVWCSDEQDLALLWVEHAPKVFFSVAHDRPISDAVVVAGGWRQGCSAGKVLPAAQKPAKSGSFEAVAHSAPTEPGDSGGPLITRNGQLVGINKAAQAKSLSVGDWIGGGLVLWRKFEMSLATAVQKEQIRRIIAEARAKRLHTGLAEPEGHEDLKALPRRIGSD